MSPLCGDSEVYATIQQIRDSPLYKHEKPYEIVGPLAPEHEKWRSNVTWDRHMCAFHDLRQGETPGFVDQGLLKILSDASVNPDILANDEDYADYVAALLKKTFAAELVAAYSLRRRTSSRPESETEPDEKWDQPAFGAHIDHTHLGGERRVRHHLSEAEINKYLQNPSEWKVRIINVWRPINHQVEDVPLAFCDPKTVEFADILVTDRPSANSVREISFIKHSPSQKWYWLSNQTTDELFMFVQWDSDTPSDCVPGIPHVAFQLDSSDKSTRPRMSVEVRSIVVTRKTD